jgi:predicted nuclease with TOPRIM domain
MENDLTKSHKYALSLEKAIQNHYNFLKKAVEEFQEKCQRVTPERRVPPDIINQARKEYKEIRDRLTEIRAIQQLLQTKYQRFYHRDPLLNKEITEFEFISKNHYSKFEFTLKQIEAQKKLERERLAQIRRKNEPVREPF